MNVSVLNSAKKKRRSSSVSSRRFHIVNKQAKLIISRKCHRVDLLDRNRHLNDHSVNNPNDISTTEEMDVNSIKTEKQDVPNQLPNSSESLQMSESTVTESNLSVNIFNPACLKIFSLIPAFPIFFLESETSTKCPYVSFFLGADFNLK